MCFWQYFQLVLWYLHCVLAFQFPAVPFAQCAQGSKNPIVGFARVVSPYKTSQVVPQHSVASTMCKVEGTLTSPTPPQPNPLRSIRWKTAETAEPLTASAWTSQATKNNWGSSKSLAKMMALTSEFKSHMHQSIPSHCFSACITTTPELLIQLHEIHMMLEVAVVFEGIEGSYFIRQCPCGQTVAEVKVVRSASFKNSISCRFSSFDQQESAKVSHTHNSSRALFTSTAQRGKNAKQSLKKSCMHTYA